MKPALGLLAALMLALPAQAQDVGRGKLLYETHCLACHYERIHQRDASKSLVRSFSALRIEVANRGLLTERKFTPEELDNIAAFLDRSHYRFKQ